jgi:hypothetical protein
MALAHEHRRHARAERTLDGGKKLRLVVDDRVMRRGILALQLVERAFLVHADKHAAVERLPQARADDLARLEHDVAVGEHDGGETARAARSNGIERARIQPVGKRIIEDEFTDAKQSHVVFEPESETLQRGQVVRVAGLVAHGRVQRPVAVALLRTERLLEMRGEIRAEAVVVEQRVVDVEQPHRRRLAQHGGLFSGAGSCQPSSPANTAAAVAGPHVPGS